MEDDCQEIIQKIFIFTEKRNYRRCIACIKRAPPPYTLLKQFGSEHMTIPRDCERPVILGEYIIEHKATVRQTASEFGISKSTVHTAVTK